LRQPQKSPAKKIDEGGVLREERIRRGGKANLKSQIIEL